MIGMSFISFMELLGISVVVALVLHYLVKYRNIAGFEGFLGKVIIGWLGAWLGSPVFGHWPARLSFAEVYPIPAFLGLADYVVACFSSVVKTSVAAAGVLACEPVIRRLLNV